jgi:phosphotransferase system HPr (HPr) family protein
MPLLEKHLKIVNEMGVHARPATQIVELTNKFESAIRLRKGDEEVDAKSIFGVMMLAAVKGTDLVLSVEGADAEQAAQAVEELFLSGFGELEPDRAGTNEKAAE